jgi:hypothetical protein
MIACMDEKLSILYLDLLHYTLLIARDASRIEDSVWSEKEIEFVHNLPSLIKCGVADDHSYFWSVSVQLFMDWLASSKHNDANRLYKVFQSELIEGIRQELVHKGLI